jgi:molecular chaperone GrpE
MTEETVETADNSPTAGEGAAAAPEAAALARAVRDLEETQARVQQNAERVYNEKRRELVLELLPVLDNLDRTLAAAESASDAALVEGVRMVRTELESVLVRYGVERVDAPRGQRFDPTIHDAVAAVSVIDPRLVGAVVCQAAPGYRFAEKLLRAAKVSVGVPSPAPPAKPPSVLVSRW